MSEINKLFTEKELSLKKNRNLCILLENIYKSIKKGNPNFTINEAITQATGAFGALDNMDTNGFFQNMSMSLAKRTWDRLIAREIVGVQPLGGPIGLYYALRYYANGAYAGSTNTEVGFNKADSTYTGSLLTSAGESLGSDTNLGLGIGNGTYIKELNIKLEKHTAEAQSRKLRATFTEEMFFDIFNMFNVDLKEDAWNTIAKEIATEIDVELIEKIMSVATANTLDFSSVAGDNKSDKYNSFISYIITLANRIGKATNHGVGNYIIASTNVSTCLESSQQFAVSLLDDSQDDWDNRVCYAGTINGMKVYRNIFWDTDKYVVGYKGKTELDAGIFYLPYIFMYLQSMHENSYQKSVGVMSRYAIGESIFGASNYYQKVDVSNMDVLY